MESQTRISLIDTTPLEPVPSQYQGILTFLFTDVEGSTRLWEQYADHMRQVMVRHDALVESSVEIYGGKVVRPRGEGDSRFAVFRRASDAVAAASAIQQALAVEPWSIPIPLRVRMALHTGEADLREGDYYGSAVNRCARLRSLAYGGQTLISQTTYDLVYDSLPQSICVRDLGKHSLKDLSHPEHIYQLVIPGLSAEFPPLKTSEQHLTNITVQLTNFIGRSREMLEVKQLLTASRLLTIVGVGGVGKTRLALQVAEEVLSSYEDGVWFVELAPLTDPTLIAPSLISILNIREEPGRPHSQTLANYLHKKTALIIFDNCEHLLQGVAELSENLLRKAPKLQILTTSREPLGAHGETIWCIPPLSTPVSSEPVQIDELTRYDAVKLFLDRVTAIKPDFKISLQNVAPIREICERLDGIPLAIELAAARIRVLPVEEVAARLQDRFRLLIGSRTAIPRQQTLRNLIDWSYDLLSENERILLQRLAVFTGGWSLSAAEEVCSGGPIPAEEVLDLLSHLVDKSLVVIESKSSGDRFRFLDTIHQYAQERLVENDEWDDFTRKHDEFYIAVADKSYGELWGPRQAYWLNQLEAENDNLRAALKRFAQNADDSEKFLLLAGSLWRFWEIHGYVQEGRTWLERALSAGSNASLYLRANGLRGAGMLARHQGDYGQAKELHSQSLALFRQLEHQLGIGRELDALGEIAWLQGDYAGATAMHTESLAIRYEIQDKEGIAISLGHLGMIALDRGQYQHARDLLEESLKLNHELDDKLYTALSLNNLGLVAYHLCEYQQAQAQFEEALAIYRQLDDRTGISNTLQNLGNVAKDRGDFQQAVNLLQECLELKHQLGDQRGIARATAYLAEVALLQGNYKCAMELTENSLAHFRELKVTRGILASLHIRSFVAYYQGNYDLASRLAKESLSLSTDIDFPLSIAYAKEVLGLCEFAAGELTKAMILHREALIIFKSLNHKRNISHTLVNLSRTAYRQGDHELTRQFLDESLAISRELDIRWSLAFSLEIKGLLERNQGNLEAAFELFQESMKLSAEQANLQGIANCLGAIAGLAVLIGQYPQAARLFAAAERVRDNKEMKMGSDDQREYDQYLRLLRDQMQPDAFETAWMEGSLLTTEAILEDLKTWDISPHLR